MKRKVRGVFAALGRGEAGPLLDSFADRFDYRFLGDTALSGRRTNRADLSRWADRLFTTLPGAVYEVVDILADGGPWRTRVAVHVRVGATLADGTPYENEFLQHFVMRWGRLVTLVTIEDTQALRRALDRQAAAGIDAAAADPIGSPA